jgi:aryl-alcohol dehydrogenase-like predicted oxidoreductase
VQPGKELFPVGWGSTDDEESLRAIQAALDMGVNFFDIAANYRAGHGEVLLLKNMRGTAEKRLLRKIG